MYVFVFKKTCDNIGFLGDEIEVLNDSWMFLIWASDHSPYRTNSVCSRWPIAVFPKALYYMNIDGVNLTIQSATAVIVESFNKLSSEGIKIRTLPSMGNDVVFWKTFQYHFALFRFGSNMYLWNLQLVYFQNQLGWTTPAICHRIPWWLEKFCSSLQLGEARWYWWGVDKRSYNPMSIHVCVFLSKNWTNHFRMAVDSDTLPATWNPETPADLLFVQCNQGCFRHEYVFHRPFTRGCMEEYFSSGDSMESEYTTSLYPADWVPPSHDRTRPPSHVQPRHRPWFGWQHLESCPTRWECISWFWHQVAVRVCNGKFTSFCAVWSSYSEIEKAIEVKTFMGVKEISRVERKWIGLPYCMYMVGTSAATTPTPIWRLPDHALVFKSLLEIDVWCRLVLG